MIQLARVAPHTDVVHTTIGKKGVPQRVWEALVGLGKLWAGIGLDDTTFFFHCSVAHLENGFDEEIHVQVSRELPSNAGRPCQSKKVVLRTVVSDLIIFGGGRQDKRTNK